MKLRMLEQLTLKSPGDLRKYFKTHFTVAVISE